MTNFYTQMTCVDQLRDHKVYITVTKFLNDNVWLHTVNTWELLFYLPFRLDLAPSD